MAQNPVSLDTRRRPRLLLEAADGGEHHIMLESVRPTVRGLCTTCLYQWRGSSAATRKARACSVLAAYLGEVNRDRQMAENVRSQVDALRGHANRSIS